MLPTLASASINFRILPGDSVDAVLQHVRSVVDDPRVEVRPSGRFSAEPSAVSNTQSAALRALERTIQGTLPGTIVAPFQVLHAPRKSQANSASAKRTRAERREALAYLDP